MGRVYQAEEDQAAAARATFGPTVTQVVFYDPDFPSEGEPWVAIGLNEQGAEIGRRMSDQPDEHGLFGVVGYWGETVKFWLEIPEELAEDDDDDGCEGHYDDDAALTAGRGIGEPYYCDGTCQ